MYLTTMFIAHSCEHKGKKRNYLLFDKVGHYHLGKHGCRQGDCNIQDKYSG